MRLSVDKAMSQTLWTEIYWSSRDVITWSVNGIWPKYSVDESNKSIKTQSIYHLLYNPQKLDCKHGPCPIIILKSEQRT